MGKRKQNSYQNASRASEIASLDEFKDQTLSEKDGKLWCGACVCFVKFNRMSLVRQHCFGSQLAAASEEFKLKSEDMKQKLFHYKKLLAWHKRENNSQTLKRAIAKQRDLVFQMEQNKRVKLPSTLEEEQLAFRLHVLRVHYKVGIPLAKLDDPDYIALVQGDKFSLGGRQGVCSMQPMLQEVLDGEIQRALKGRKQALIMDGSTVTGDGRVSPASPTSSSHLGTNKAKRST